MHWLLTGKGTFAKYAVGLCTWLLSQMHNSNNCIVGGPDVTWCSVEHNIDSFFALHLVAHL